MLAEIMDNINILKSLPTQNDSQNPPEPTNVVPTNRRDPPVYSGQSTQIGGMWNLKHNISSPIFYELLIKTELKGCTALYLMNLCADKVHLLGMYCSVRYEDKYHRNRAMVIIWCYMAHMSVNERITW